ncbi:cobalt/nickel transport system ATP-binding protein [Anaerobacterium chartisolvens]|uniref:ABC transporter ATP-binding protein n=1 Tax=Anaerobacterium chartisolvens TaxID=1297424 RepID=A0A369B7U3_9FIRM|nr:ATP-binding cassette domain-containing protein [Anaerobacterium chartisolvens]RCX16607.1 cobalt/nickel transport system ATP-binding protein [Anaerobacterium chartisolvens]
MGQSILEARDVNYIYSDGTHALNGITMAIEKGKTTAVLGGNGAGKSTLFLCFNGILKPRTGSILFDKSPIDYSRKGMKELRSHVGIVFQDPDSQLFSASVYQDISFGPLNMKLPQEEVAARVKTAMERTGILHLKDKPTHSLSFGQKKRAAIAGVLAMSPQVLVLDEPTAGLDPSGVSEIMKLLKEAQRDLGISVVIATHDIDIVPLYCDYTYVMDQGSLVAEGTPHNVFSQKEELRKVNLRLPRIGHLMEILSKKDGFRFSENALTISQARRAIKALWESGDARKER